MIPSGVNIISQGFDILRTDLSKSSLNMTVTTWRYLNCILPTYYRSCRNNEKPLPTWLANILTVFHH